MLYVDEGELTAGIKGENLRISVTTLSQATESEGGLPFLFQLKCGASKMY